MSEQAPRTNPRLENFEANKAAKEREAFEAALYADAGTHDFSDTARKRVEEADAYEQQLEFLAFSMVWVAVADAQKRPQELQPRLHMPI